MHFEEVVAPLGPELAKNRAHVTAANIATAQVAVATLKAAEYHEEVERIL